MAVSRAVEISSNHNDAIGRRERIPFPFSPPTDKADLVGGRGFGCGGGGGCVVALVIAIGP